LHRMSASLCQAVTGQAGSQEMLETIELANLFLVSLDDERQWYRFHDLFREALCVRLQASQPERVPDLHRRAARWYETQGELREAVTHALAASDFSYAADLMEQAAPHLFLSGEARTISNWILSLTDPVLCAHTRLALSTALHLLNSSTIQLVSISAEIERIITRLQTLLPSAFCLSAEERVLIEHRLRLLQAWVEIRNLRKRGKIERALQLVQELEELSPDPEVNWNLIPLFLTSLFADHLPQKRDLWIPMLLLAKQQVMQVASHLSTIRIMVLLAQTYIQMGQLRQAKRECLEALALIEQYDVRTGMTGFLYVNLFDIAYAQNRLEEAASCLPHLLRLAQEWGQTYLLTLGETRAVRLALARGDLAIAYQALQRMEILVEQEGYTHFVLSDQLIRVDYWLASGNLAKAQEWAAQQMCSLDAGGRIHSEEILKLLQVLLAQQQFSQAVELLSRSREQLDQTADIHIAWFLALSVVVSQGGKSKQVWHEAERLLALTEPEGHIRVYLDAGEAMKRVLQSLLDVPQDEEHGASTVSRSYVLTLLAAFEQEEHKRALRIDESLVRPQEQKPLPPLPSLLPGPASSAPAHIEPLT